MPYEELVRREVFEPVGLTGCQTPAITSVAAGGIRCTLNDMLTWARMWLDQQVKPPGKHEPWLTQAQRDALWTPYTPMPMSERQRRWDNGNFVSYGYGWRLSDVDGVRRVAHTGTLSGAYSALTLLPEKKTGFVFLISGEGGDARLVLNQALVKQFTAPGKAPPASWYIEQLAQEREAKKQSSPAPVTSPRELASPAALAHVLGEYRDPWFGAISICERDGHVRFTSAKSPRLTGNVMRVGERLLVDWDAESVDVEAWLTFHNGTLTLAKTDPEGDFSFDYEDLLFKRTGWCK
jgi:hypothetical protein